MMSIKMTILLFLNVLVLLPLALESIQYNGIPYPEPGPDINGYSYCGTRRIGDQCCAGRDDRCTVPILDTVCYCDIFCNRTVADCCPDFWRLCIGIAPPPGALTPPPLTSDITPIQNNCHHEGVTYDQGSTIKVNCNNCSCVKISSHKEYNWNCTQKICLIREDIISAVNEGYFGWRASNYSFLWGKTLSEGINQRLGTLKPTAAVRDMTSIGIMIDDKLPDQFDAREQWPGMIHKVKDQGDCGASWAFSTAAVASDRLSIHSHGMFKDSLSVQQIVSCDFDHMQKGCRGGYVDRAWWFLRRVGVVTDTCYPYSSMETALKGKCKIQPKVYQLPASKVGCPVGDRRSRVYQATPPYRISVNEGEIMKEIMQNGPVQATMEVKEDFFMYNGGVYQYSVPDDIMNEYHRKSGYHSVKIIGWGTDNTDGQSKKYWLVANSWGTQWGEDGYFRIVRGANECDIESFVVGAWAKVNGRQLIRRMHQRMRNGNHHVAASPNVSPPLNTKNSLINEIHGEGSGMEPSVELDDNYNIVQSDEEEEIQDVLNLDSNQGLIFA